MKKLIALILCTAIIISCTTFCIYAEDEIKVVIDGDELKMDVSPVIVNGRTMVPLRAIFEYFGADIEWWQDTKRVYAYLGSVNVSMSVGRDSAIVNYKKVELDSPAVIIEGRTLVPLRVIAEAFYADVSWIAEIRTVVITTPYPKKDTAPLKEFDKYKISTSESNFEKFDFVIDKNLLTISGKFGKSELNSIILEINDTQKEAEADSNGIISLTVNLDTVGIDGTVPIMMYHNVPGENRYISYINKTVVITKDDDGYCFKKPLVYDENIELLSEWTTPAAFVNFTVDEEIKAMSDEICKGITDSYQKVKALHKWVCENIYYDYDYYNKKSDKLYYSDKEVLQARRTVCGGYTNLMASLIRAQGIPCRMVNGFALGLGYSKQWTEEIVNGGEINHAWVQAYIDNRWVTIDSTWDSDNKFNDGKMEYGGMKDYIHFDMSMEFASSDHRFIAVEKKM